MALCLLIGVLLILTLPRGKVITAFLLAFFTIPFGQVVVFGGLHFTAVRILILAALARMASFRGRDKYPGGFTAVDWVVVLWSISSILAFWIQFPEMSAVITGLGNLVDKLAGYLAVRFLIPDGEAIRRAIRALAVICVIQGVCMLIEKITSINIFGLVGAMPLAAAVRDGHVRAAGSLGALTAGPMAGVLIPVFLWLWTERNSRRAGGAGIVGAMTMVITSTSSTSWLAIGGSLLGLAFWPLRKRMRLVRWGLAGALVGLHMIMKAPVWALIARIDLTGSSSGYQRYQLVDMTIRHFSDWWLIGAPDYITWGWMSWDTCNQFVDVALTAGLLPLICYIAIFKRCFGVIGTARRLVNGDRRREWLLWCLGSALFATITAQFGINYMAVLIMSFFPLVAWICVANFEARQSVVPSVGRPVEEQLAPAAAKFEGALT